MIALQNWISAGEVSAERDKNLKHYFYDAGVSRDIVSNDKQYLLLGRKGAGKTAVYLHLISRPAALFKEEDIVIGLSLQNYNWRAHALLIDSQKVGGSEHRNSWRFVICLEVLKAIQSKFKSDGKPLPKEIAEAVRAIEKLFSGPLKSWSDLIGSKLFSLASLKIPSAGLSEQGITVGGGEITFEQVSEDKSLRSALNNNISVLTDWLESKVKEIPAPYRIFLVFDRLDEAWLPNYMDESKAIISGLLHAAEHSLSTFSGSVRPLIFLRDDIFGTLDINDRNKFREDCSSHLRWSELEIERLLITRINFYARQADVPEIALLQDIFVDAKIRSKTTPVKHAFKRTMCRPRDMVALMGRIFAVVKDDVSLIDGNKIKSKAIYDAEPGYSDYLYEELSDEWRNQNPELFSYLGAIENIRYAVFSTEEFEDALAGKGVVNDRSSYRAVTRFLFENSIIGLTVGASKNWRYKCFNNNQAFMDASVFKVHPGLIKHLGLKERTSPNSPATADIEDGDDE